MLKVTCDQNANQKMLRKLENKGFIELHGVNIEGIRSTKRIDGNRKALPIAIIGSKHSTIGNMVLALENSPWKRILEIIGRSNEADALHFEGHVRLGHDVFVTSDRDILDHREVLEREFRTRIMTDVELELLFLNRDALGN